jgi:hypothetical protein
MVSFGLFKSRYTFSSTESFEPLNLTTSPLFTFEPNSVTTTSAFFGEFEKNETRSEFLKLIASKLH